jgi:hypothetical protein
MGVRRRRRGMHTNFGTHEARYQTESFNSGH